MTSLLCRRQEPVTLGRPGSTCRLETLPFLLFQVINRKYNPSRRLILFGCAAASSEDRCSNSALAGFDFEWGQVKVGDLVTLYV